MSKNLKIKIIFIGVAFLIIPFVARADYQGQRVNFFVDSNYDLLGRDQLSTSLIYITPKIYFYIEDNWWNSLEETEKQEILNVLSTLSQEFQNKIYPTLTSTFGSEWKPGIDTDEHITVLLHQIKKEAGGYFNNGNEYPKIQYPFSNEREMVYLNTEHITSPQAKIFLAHEFMHLITFSQKERLFDVQEEVWLNEARSEYASTFLNYDSVYEGSNLQRRVRDFLVKPTDSLTEWQERSYDYGVLNLFTQYLVDQYSVKILVDSLKMRKTGIESLNEALKQNGYSEDFNQVFTNWTIAVLVNDCSLGERYCYKNESLRKFQVIPTTNFLPLVGKSSLQVTKFTKNWASNWEKIIGGKGNLKLEFEGSPEVNFRVPYIVENSAGKISVNFLQLDSFQKGSVIISDFGSKNLSLAIIPSIQSKISGFGSNEPSYYYSFKFSILEAGETPSLEEQKYIQELLSQIEFLKKQIAQVQAEIAAILAKKELNSFSCRKLENNLYYGMMENSEVRCLQEFLKIQGPEVYPEGLVTGNFLSLTQQALIRFQEKYASEILIPLGLQKGTGYVGPATRTKINQLLGF